MYGIMCKDGVHQYSALVSIEVCKAQPRPSYGEEILKPINPNLLDTVFPRFYLPLSCQEEGGGQDEEGEIRPVSLLQKAGGRF